MRFSPFSRALAAAVLLATAVPVTSAVSPAPARAGVDTIIVDVPDPPGAPGVPQTTTGKKRIVIGGSGVRIEGDFEDEDSASTFNYDITIGKKRHYGSEDIVRVGESVYVAPGEVITGDVVVFGGNAVIEGTVAGSVVVLGGEIRVRNGAEVKGDVVAIGGKIAEDDSVIIRGEKIVVGGIATRIGDTFDMGGEKLRGIFSAFLVFVGFILFLSTTLFLRTRVERTGEFLAAGLLRSFGAGVLASVALQFGLLIVMIPLVITVVGIPLALILLFSYVGVFVIACTVFVYTVGRAIASRTGVSGGAFAYVLVGFVALVIPELIAFAFDTVGDGPMSIYLFLKVVSLVLWVFGYIIGLGSIVLSRFGTRPPAGVEPPAERPPVVAPAPTA